MVPATSPARTRRPRQAAAGADPVGRVHGATFALWMVPAHGLVGAVLALEPTCPPHGPEEPVTKLGTDHGPPHKVGGLLRDDAQQRVTPASAKRRALTPSSSPLKRSSCPRGQGEVSETSRQAQGQILNLFKILIFCFCCRFFGISFDLLNIVLKP